jgi:serine/threonine-protein kinase HipA
VSGKLTVSLHGFNVATIENTTGDLNVVTIERDFANDPEAPTLSLKAFRDPATGAYRTTPRPTQTVVHPYFANLLPEGPLRKYLAAHAHVKSIRDFPLLWLLGDDLPGALIIRDADGEELPPPDDDAATEADDEHDPSVLRFSLSGVQLKFSASGDPDRGLTIPVRGLGGHWIVKLPDQRYDRVPENEFSMMTFAKAVGIDVPRVGLVSRNDIGGVPIDVRFEGNAYYIERFDRKANSVRVHTEDFAQINQLYPSEKYKRFNFDQLLLQVADAMGSEAALALIERIVFNVGIGNGDMHAKNWSVIYLDGKTPSLAPAYDYVSTLLYVEAENVGMNLAGTKQFLDIDMERLLRLAARAHVSTKMAETRVRQMVQRMHETWPTLKDTLPLADDLRETITEHMARVPLFSGRGTPALGVRTLLGREEAPDDRSPDRFERALSEAIAARRVAEAEAAIKNDRDKKILDDWALSVASQLDRILESSQSFGEAQGKIRVIYSGGKTKGAYLTYERSGSVLRIMVAANAKLEPGDNFRPGILVGDDFDLNTAVMNVDVKRMDIDASASSEFRYGLQPVSKVISVGEEQFLRLVEHLIKQAK